jgi:hypothetical protein|tara:strand:- start:10 stop:198 length:189 start_codon:yes stop_codon:yes gene_type:complete
MPKHRYELQGHDGNGNYEAKDSVAAYSKTEAVNYFRERFADDEEVTLQYIVDYTANTREVVA